LARNLPVLSAFVNESDAKFHDWLKMAKVIDLKDQLLAGKLGLYFHYDLRQASIHNLLTFCDIYP